MIEHTPKFRIWVNRLAIISLTIGTLTMGIIFFYFSKEKNKGQVSCQEWMASTIEPLAFQAEIVGIYQGDKPKCLGTIELSVDQPSFIKICECSDEKKMLNWVEKGDSVFKKSNERTLYVKKSENAMREFAYPCCE